MRSIPLRDGCPAVGADRALGASAAARADDLENFWPSRRPHAYDEFCR